MVLCNSLPTNILRARLRSFYVIATRRPSSSDTYLNTTQNIVAILCNIPLNATLVEHSINTDKLFVEN
ncbi:hypothetical protein C8R48DRAFT_736766 [Suillus tomentosus]|nr:hypothetical protein C8R48DRAFT_736766 [Suillus tomentosus]